MGANFHEANLDRAVLEQANLTAASLVGTRVQDAVFTGSLVHGISAWNLEGEPASQGHMIVTPLGDPPVIVGDLELALFVNLILYGKRLAAAIQKRCPRMVLCVGRHRGNHGRLPCALPAARGGGSVQVRSIRRAP